jgi:hypothetical protein
MMRRGRHHDRHRVALGQQRVERRMRAHAELLDTTAARAASAS